MIKLFSPKGQHLSEYAVLISVVGLTLTGMGLYVRRGLQGRYKDASDSITQAVISQVGAEDITQYEPYYFATSANTGDSSVLREEKTSGGQAKKTIEKLNTREAVQFIFPAE